MLELIIGLSLGCIALLALAVIRSFPNLLVSQIFLALLLATAAFSVHPLLPASWTLLTIILQTMIPALFWFLCQFAFIERPKFQWYWLSVAGYSALVPAVYRIAFYEADYGLLFKIVLFDIPGYLEYLLIGAGLWAVVQHWVDDLVASRRRLRALVIALVGMTVLVNVVSVNFGWGGELFQRVVVLLCVFVTAAQMLSIPKGLLFGVSESLPPVVEADPIDLTVVKKNKQLAQLNLLMTNGFYTNEKLTIAQLAKELSLPEYIVRNLINEQLGFRNFNDFVNQWRIKDATDQLISEPEKPVMNIALDLGYRTLSSFNRAFKERTEKSPTQYRQERLK
jgi:AraC-like DNA-binding protein